MIKLDFNYQCKPHKLETSSKDLIIEHLRKFHSLSLKEAEDILENRVSEAQWLFSFGDVGVMR